MKSKLIVVCILACLLVFSLPLGKVCAGSDGYWVNVEVLNRNVLFAGESASVYVSSNFSLVHLSVVDYGGKSVFDKYVAANSTVVVDVPEVYGVFKVTASVGVESCTARFWLQNTGDLKPLSLPYSWSWKGVDYTFSASYELFASSGGDAFGVEWLGEFFTKLKPSVSVLGNKDMVYVGCYGKDVAADSWIMNTWFGVKIRVNGTLAKETDLKWSYKEVSGGLLWSSERFCAGKVVYDYSDFNRYSTGLVYSVDKSGLKTDVTLSKSFDVDPVIFSADFEGGDTSEFTADVGSPNVVSGGAQSGTYKMNCTSNDAATGVYRDLGSNYNELYLSGWLYVEPAASMPTAASLVEYGEGGNLIVRVTYSYPNSRWELLFHNGSAYTTLTSSMSLSNGTWHNVYFRFNVSDTQGIVQLTVDDVSRIDETGIDTLRDASYNDINRVTVQFNPAAQAYYSTVYWDNIVMDVNPIGSDSAAPTYSGLSTSTTVCGVSCQFNATFDDETDLTTTGGYIFSTNNTGSWANDTWTAFSSNPETVSTSKTLKNTFADVISCIYYFNDTSDNWNNTGTQSITLTADSYTVTLSTVNPAPSLGETITVDIAVSRASGVAVSSWQANVTKTGAVYADNYVESSFSVSEDSATSHTFNVSGLYDVDCGASVTPTCTGLTVAWGGESGSSYSSPTVTPTPSPAPPEDDGSSVITIPTLPEDFEEVDATIPIAVVVVCVGGLVGIGIYVDQNRDKGWKKIKSKKQKVNWKK